LINSIIACAITEFTHDRPRSPPFS
jgi:hypothetical protein